MQIARLNVGGREIYRIPLVAYWAFIMPRNFFLLRRTPSFRVFIDRRLTWLNEQNVSYHIRWRHDRYKDAKASAILVYAYVEDLKVATHYKLTFAS